MRVRADQVRVGHRFGGSVVTRVQPTLDWGVVRITLENVPDPVGLLRPGGTFSYLPDDLIDVQRPSSAEGSSADDDVVMAHADRGCPEFSSDAYRVEYQAIEGDGYVVVRAGDSDACIVDRAAALLREQGIDARIRRIVPLTREPHLRRRLPHGLG
jgi:hypothetical protein